MSMEYDKLNKEYKDLAKEHKRYGEEYDKLGDALSNIERKKQDLKKKMVQMKKDNFEEGLAIWKETLTEDELTETEDSWYRMFKLTPEEKLKARYIEQELHAGNSGAIGGRATFHFTPTSIGVIVSMTVGGEDYKLTDFSNF